MISYEYKFVRVELKSGWLADTPKEDYHNIVEDHAKEGWRLFQLFAQRCLSPERIHARLRPYLRAVMRHQPHFH